MALVNPRLDETALPGLPADVARPAYDRKALQPGIVHLGLGAFMRAHLAVATETALHATGNLHWGITGVSLRCADTRDALAPQQGLYTLAVRDGNTQRLQVLGCVLKCLVAPEAPKRVRDALAAPTTRIVSLTVTEKGYRGDSPTLHTLLLGLAQRQARGLGGVTLLSLDNLPHNGSVLRERLLAQAGPAAPWIDTHCTFPCSMVDRIVPRTTHSDREQVAATLGFDDAWPVVAEPFFDWVVEDHFAAGRPAWEHAGVRFVANAAPWETLKLRLVNGGHSAIAYLGAMAGWATVHQAMGQPALRRFINTLMRDEIEPTLPHLPGQDLAAYRASLLQRFTNPALAHRTQQIATDGTQKLPQRWLATVRQRLAAGQPVKHLGLALAAWLHYLRGVDEAGRAFAIDDPLAAELATLRGQAAAAHDVHAEVTIWTHFTPVFGDLAGQPALVSAIARPLAQLRQHGVAATLETCA